MFLSISILIVSLGIFMRGFLYYLASQLPMNKKLKQISFSKSENALEYTEENYFACKAYMIIGLIYSLFTLVLIITINSFITKFWLFFILITILTDLFINTLVHIKISINNYDKNNENK